MPVTMCKPLPVLSLCALVAASLSAAGVSAIKCYVGDGEKAVVQQCAAGAVHCQKLVKPWMATPDKLACGNSTVCKDIMSLYDDGCEKSAAHDPDVVSRKCCCTGDACNRPGKKCRSDNDAVMVSCDPDVSHCRVKVADGGRPRRGCDTDNQCGKYDVGSGHVKTVRENGTTYEYYCCEASMCNTEIPSTTTTTTTTTNTTNTAIATTTSGSGTIGIAATVLALVPVVANQFPRDRIAP